MQLSTLYLTDFRNYQSLSLDVGGRLLHLFVGKNASGKTNLLDSISILSTHRSFLGLDEEDLVRHGQEYYRIRGTIRNDSGEDEILEITSQLLPRKKKACFSNDVKIASADMVGRLPTVVFLPQDLELFTGAPAERRRFLDDILSQVSPMYFRTLSEYQKLLKQRNMLLRQLADGKGRRADLEPWDRNLAEKGSKVTVARLELIEAFSLSLQEELRALGEKWSEVKIRYQRKGSERQQGALEAEMVSLLRDAAEKDIIIQSTTVGPHRDDWEIHADGYPLSTHASRGQQRAAVLALLFLESSYLELKRGEKPVILLDDVYSELDDLHQERVTAAFPEHQVLLTATHLPPRLEKATVWNVSDGTIRQSP